MKSGSATKIILETLFMISLNGFLQPVTSLSRYMSISSSLKQFIHPFIYLSVHFSPINNLLLSYELAYRYTYLQSHNIAKLLEAAGRS